MNEAESSRLEALERRLERLTSVLIVQSILLAVVVLLYAFSTMPIIAACLLVAVPVLVFNRKSLPKWGRSLGRFFGQFGVRPSPHTESNEPVSSETTSS